MVLYTRLDETQILEHDLRRAILRAVRERPGVCGAELARLHGVDPKTIAHHLRKLERAGRVRRQPSGWSVPGPAAPRAPPVRIVAALHALREGAVTPAALGRVLGVPRGTAGRMLGALERLGLAAREAGAWRVSERADEALCPGPGLGET